MNSTVTRKQSFFSKAFNLPIIEKSRLKWVDYLRGIAIILVVYRHALIGIERAGIYVPEILSKANTIFYSFRMPLFFIISGLFISKSLLKKKFTQLLNIKFENLLYPYFIWCFLQITLQILLSDQTNASRGLVDYSYMLYQPRNLDQFWYLPALFNCTIIYLLLKVKLRANVWVQYGIGILFYFLSPFLQDISMISDFMEFYIFFVIGESTANIFFKTRTQEKLRNPLLLLGSLPVFALVQLYYLQHDEYYYINDPLGKIQFFIIALVGCFSMFLIALRLEKLNKLNFLRIYGYHSLFIYVMHVFVTALSRIVLVKLGIVDATTLLLLSIFTGITFPVIFYNLFISNGPFWFLFSYKRPFKPNVQPQTLNINHERKDSQ